MAATHILADRMAALLGGHEPGWRLPRLSMLARRYNVSVAEVDAALTELTARHLVRRLPDGQVYRASPVDYLISLENLPGLASRIDPMGGELVCERRHTSWRRVPEEIGGVIGTAPGETACVIRCAWKANGDPAALSTTYLPGQWAQAIYGAEHPIPGSAEGGGSAPAGPGQAEDAASAAVPLNLLRLLVPAAEDRAAHAGTGNRSAGEAMPARPDELAGQPRALHIEMRPPAPSVARSLRLDHSQSAVVVGVRFDDPASGTPVALTVTVLRPDMFRIVVTSAAAQPPR